MKTDHTSSDIKQDIAEHRLLRLSVVALSLAMIVLSSLAAGAIAFTDYTSIKPGSTLLEFAGRGLSSSRKLTVVTTAALAMALVQSVALTARDKPPNLDVTFKFPEAEKVVALLDDKLSKKTPVLTGVPSDNPLIYYGLQHGIERMSFLSLGMVTEKYDSLWVVENRRDNKCLLSVIVEANGLDTLYQSRPELIAEFAPVAIYLFGDCR